MRRYMQDKILRNIKELCSLSPEEYRDTFRNPEKDFTRERKQPLGSMVRTGLLNSGSCLNQQLRQSHGLGERPTASAYIQQRDKLSPAFFRRLFSRQLSHIGGHTPYRGKYAIIACDGSGVNIHPNKDDMSTRIIHTRTPDDEKACNQVHLNALCTVPDGYFLDYEIQDFSQQDEIGACAAMMGRLSSMDLGGLVPLLCLDRGYESFYLMMLADSLGICFCIRMRDIGSKGISSRYSGSCDDEGCFDIISDRKYTYSSFVLNDRGRYPDYVVCARSSCNPFIPQPSNAVGGRRKNGCRNEPSYYRFAFRIVRFRLPGGGFEVLATNLDGEEASLEDLMEIYHFRWGIETAFRQLKYDDFAAFIHTRKKEAAVGEIVLSLIFHNICSLVIKLIAQKAIRKRSRILPYAISYSDLSSSMRMLIAGRDPTASVDKIVRELEITLQPIRNGRAFIRQLNRRSFVPFIYRAA